MPVSKGPPESEQKKDGINWTPSLSIHAKNFHARNFHLSTSDLRSLYNWSGNHTHDQSFGHFGHQEARELHCGDKLPAYQGPGETLPPARIIRAPNEESHSSPSPSSPPVPKQLELIGSSSERVNCTSPARDDNPVEAQDPSTADQPPGYELAITEVQEMTASGKGAAADMQRVSNMGGDGTDLVEWGDGKAEYRPRWGGDFLHPGRVVNPFSGGNDELDRRTLVVLSTTGNGYAECVALCRHPDHSGEERASFYHAHAAVYSSGDAPPPPPPPPVGGSCGEAGKSGRGRNEAFEIRFKSPRFRMQDSCYVNFEHTWTIRPDFPVMDLGYIRRDQRRKLMEMHVRVQRDLFDRNIEEHGLGERLKSAWG